MEIRRTEIAGPLGIGRYGAALHEPLPETLRLIIDQEERPVLPAIQMRDRQRTADSPSELVALQNSARLREKVACVQFVVADEFEDPAMKSICARLGSRVEERAPAVELGRVRALLHAELLERVDGGLNKCTALVLLADVNAVQQE